MKKEAWYFLKKTYPLVSGSNNTNTAPTIGTIPNINGGYIIFVVFNVIINGATIEPIRAIIEAEMKQRKLN